MNKYQNKYTVIFILAVFILITQGCKKFLEAPLPIDQLATETVFKSRPTILSAVNGMYNGMASGALHGNYIRFTYWISDEGVITPMPGSEVGDIISGNIVPTNTNLIPWSWFYLPTYRANELIAKMPSVDPTIMNETEKKQIIAAAKYVRAYEHFLMANSWGDVPLITSTSTSENLTKPRTPVAQVYAAVIKDLTEAAADLPTTVNASNSITIHNRYQVLALLAKVHLYLGNWTNAENAASEVISSGQYQLVTGVNNVFRRGSREAIFSFGSTGTGLLFDNRTVIGWLTIPASVGNATTNYCALTTNVISSFETGDQRRVNGNWVINLFGFNFPNKYLYNTSAAAATIAAAPQDFIVQRLAEMYLIRAEARAQQSKITGTNSAAEDLNLIRNRAGLPNTTATTQATMLAAIEKERVTELFCEGHRWYDLKRTNRLNTVLGALPHKAANYKPHYNLWPITQSEMNTSPNLTQNPGY
ncbi:MAG: RagB/SusD family nutrient uptake outer membrane protein [Chitinophagales bacterium]|nr:RagB/SusD family nutrient uptake outer membrane protein [Chitinophagales bacterium]